MAQSSSSRGETRAHLFLHVCVCVCTSHMEATGDASVQRQRSDCSRGIVETRVIIDEICNLDRVEEVDFALARLSICGFNVA